ncbi:MAG: Ig-like domain-containing protein, partial [Planctomycetota bacterium]
DASTNPEGVRVTVVDAVTSDESAPVSAAPTTDLLGMELTFASTVPVGSTLTIVGLTDLAGNPLFPVDGFALEAETGTALGFDASTEARAVQGARNDTITLEFDAPLGPWDLLDRSRLSMVESPSGDPIDLSSSSLQQTSPTTLVVTLTSGSIDQLESGATYQVTLTSDPSSPIATSQGVELVGSIQTSALAVVGDISQGPTAASFAVVDSLDARQVVVVFDEAVFPSAAAALAEYSIGATSPTSATLVGDRAVRLTFASPVSVGSFVDVTATAAVDASQNAASGTLSLAVQADVDAPVITGATADIVPGAALDLVTVTFDEPLDPTLARSPTSYAVTSVGGGTVAFVTYDEETLTTTLAMDGLIQGETLGIQVDAASDLAGNALTAPISTTATVDGDDVPPAIVSAMVDRFSDPTGRTVLVLFTEPVRPVFVTSASAWSSTGAENVQAVELVAPDRLLMQLDGALAPSSVLSVVAGVIDEPGNVAGVLSVDPAD